ncbi:hypothetical protein [Microcystis phage MinS1]|nr:hypothetical protein [Microcystis phage MinS1]
MSALSDALNEANVENWSARDIARRGGDKVHFGTIADYLAGRHGRPGENVLTVFSQVLSIPMPKLRELADLPRGEREPWDPPAVADRLTRRQRRVVDDLIHLLVDATAGEEGDDGGDTAPTKLPRPARTYPRVVDEAARGTHDQD